MSVLTLTVGAFLVVLTWLVLNVLLPLHQNIKIAKSSGIKYVVVPWYGYNRLTALLLSRTLLRFLNAILPAPEPTSWRRLVSSSWPWKVNYAPFDALGSDTFFTVAPGGMILNTADANVINQITSRGIDYPKPTHLYKSVDIYGKNVVSSEGAVWRRHRKLIAPSFSERNNHLVWNETLEQTQEMLKVWGVKDTVETVDNDIKMLSLNVISKAGLGRKMEWPAEVKDGVPKLGGGHRMSFPNSLQYLLRNVFYVMVFPKWILKWAPFSRWRKAYEAYHEWGAYMAEIFAEKEAELRSSQSMSSTVDIIGQLVKGQEENPTQPTLSSPELLGNLFVLIFAGHETSASSIHFSLLFLAMHPEIQRTVQDSLSQIFSSRLHDPSRWNYEHDLPKLLNSMLGAVLNEELRIIPPTITVPKIVNPTSASQDLFINGREAQIPGGTMIRLCIPSVHQNPKFWPRSSVSDGRCCNGTSTPESDASVKAQREDLACFRPDRWLASPSSPSLSEPLYTPPKGSYIPFSEGQRACPGRRFAQVEILASLAVILSKYSVELCPSVVDGEGEEQKKKRWTDARDEAWMVLRTDLKLVITVQLKGKGIPLRFVRRGEGGGH